ncbi:MAG: glycosyltransferase family 87 protein [Phenylobacterium sp.]
MSALQRNLLLLIALVLALQTGVNLARYLQEPGAAQRFGGDFICFWQAAQRARHGDLAGVYDPAFWRGVVSGHAASKMTWFVYPPFVLLPLRLLGDLGYGPAVAWWSLLPLPFYFGLIFLLARRTAPDLAAGTRLQAFAAIAALTLPFLSASLFSGQIGAFVAVLFLAAAYLWPDRPILAGLCLGLMAVKPQLGVLFPFALAAAGQWRTMAAAAATVLALVASSLVWPGAAVWNDYAQIAQIFGRFIGQGHAVIAQLAVGPYVSLLAAGLPAALAATLQAGVSLGVLAVVIRVFRQAAGGRDDGRLDLRLGLLAAGALLAIPYSLSYDTPMLALAILPLVTRAWRRGLDGWTCAAITGLLVLPYLQPILIPRHLPFALAALLLAFGALFRRYELEAPADAAAAGSGWLSAIRSWIAPRAAIAAQRIRP